MVFGHVLHAQVHNAVYEILTVGDAGVDGRVSIHQARLVLELMVDPIEQVADAATDNVNHRELPCRGEECVSLHCLVRVCNS